MKTDMRVIYQIVIIHNIMEIFARAEPCGNLLKAGTPPFNMNNILVFLRIYFPYVSASMNSFILGWTLTNPFENHVVVSSMAWKVVLEIP